MPPTARGAILVAGIPGMGFALVWWNGAIKKLGATTTGVYGNLIPFVGVLGSVVLLGEPLRIGQVLGGLCVMGGAAVVRHQRATVSGRSPGRLPG